jgi:hypothetical protein
MNNAAAFRFTGDQKYSDNAIFQAHNYINLSKNPQNMLWESTYHGVESQWHDEELGLPYVGQNSSAARGSFQSWMVAKVAMGLLNTAFHADCTPADKQLFLDKAKQMGDYLVEYFVHAGTITLNAGHGHPSRLPARYLSATNKHMMPDKVEGGLSWLLIPVGYAAVRGNQKARDVYADMLNDNSAYADKSTGQFIRSDNWSGDCGITDLGDGTFKIVHMGNDTTDLVEGVLGHHIYLRSPSNKETWHRIISKNGGNELVVTDALAKINRSQPGHPSNLTVTDPMPEDPGRSIAGDDLSLTYYFQATGPQIEDCNNDKDWAIRQIEDIGARIPGVEDEPIDWAAGQHFNSWWKNWGFVLYNWDTPLSIRMLLEAQQGNIL